MEIRRAMALFRIRDRVPMEELNASFRGLVKKYHPDKVRDYPDWAHERMAEINDAYETLASWISRPQETAGRPKAEPRPEPAAEAETDTLRAHDVPSLEGRDAAAFDAACTRFLDGLGLYFQYGLDNPAYRVEGVRRFRFREALRSAMRGRDELEECAAATGHPTVRSVARFSRLCIADMDLGRPVYSAAETAVRRLDERFFAARRTFDGAVKVILFPELVPAHLRQKTAAGLYSCYAEFIVYLTVFPEGERRKAAILATARYDAFMDILEYRNSGHLNI